MNDASIGAGNLSDVLASKSLKAKTGAVPAEVLSSLDILASSVADGIVLKTGGNPRKMARVFDPMKKYLDSRVKKTPEALRKKAILYLKARIEFLLRKKVNES
ncbi:MAG: hypothetical protein QG650_197 [Patescibacteria group bacterium]|nr:hypothetical protein [Patescibacteria group bacterium]